jgi:hypothetical protein
MDSEQFTHRLHDLTAGDIVRVAAALRAGQGSAEGELAWWRATIEVTGAVRRHRCSRQAGLAAHRAAAAVLGAARAAGIDDDGHRADVTAVARAAGEAARLLVVEEIAGTGPGETLLQPWQLTVAA